MKLPERVTAPIAVDRTMVMSVRSGRSPPVRNSAAATRAEAPPPKPLKAATSCGMAVISTRWARSPPTAPPTTRPATTTQTLTISVRSRVTTIAKSMPRAASWFPRRAVTGDWSRFRPMMKRTAAIRYR